MLPLIYILTYRRERVLTYEALPESLKKRALLVVDREDQSRLSGVYPGVITVYCPQQGRGIGSVRQWVLDNAEGKLIAMLDDDLGFQLGEWNSHTRKRRWIRANDLDIRDAFREHFDKLKEPGVGYTTCSTPFFNNDGESWAIARPAHSFFINRPRVEAVNARFDRTPVMVDMNFAMECITSGLAGWSSRWFAAVDRSKAASGGIASLPGARGKKHEEAARILAARWPKYVSLVDQSDNKRHMANIGTPVDVRFQFKRAWKDAQR